VTTYQTLSDPTAVLGKRFGAYVVDSIIGLAIAAAIFGATVSTDTIEGVNPCFELNDALDGTSESDWDACTVEAPNGEDFFVIYNGEDATAFEVGDTYLIWIALFGYSILVFWIWQGLSGMTVGKALFGIRTVNEEGQAPGIGKATVRSLLWIVDGIGCCVPLVGPIAAVSTKGHRRIGDMVAKTYVVEKNAMGAGPVVIPGVTPPAPAAAFGSPGYGAQPGWGTTPQGMPTTPPAGAPPGTPATPPTAGEPQWDAARNAYIQWDAGQQKWLQFDDATQQWRPID
jgi:uncharacterized RDD family membrane protein YckC